MSKIATGKHAEVFFGHDSVDIRETIYCGDEEIECNEHTISMPEWNELPGANWCEQLESFLQWPEDGIEHLDRTEIAAA